MVPARILVDRTVEDSCIVEELAILKVVPNFGDNLDGPLLASRLSQVIGLLLRPTSVHDELMALLVAVVVRAELLDPCHRLYNGPPDPSSYVWVARQGLDLLLPASW